MFKAYWNNNVEEMSIHITSSNHDAKVICHNTLSSTEPLPFITSASARYL